jgi:glutaredoxin
VGNGRELPILYTQIGCGDSRRVRDWLAARGVPFVERNVTNEPGAARALAATGVFATPLLVVGGTHLLGFRPDAIATALGEER